MDLQKAIKTNLHYYKQVQAHNEAHRTKAESSHLRKEHLEKQNTNNYQNEYDRESSLVKKVQMIIIRNDMKEKEFGGNGCETD